MRNLQTLIRERTILSNNHNKNESPHCITKEMASRKSKILANKIINLSNHDKQISLFTTLWRKAVQQGVAQEGP